MCRLRVLATGLVLLAIFSLVPGRLVYSFRSVEVPVRHGTTRAPPRVPVPLKSSFKGLRGMRGSMLELQGFGLAFPGFLSGCYYKELLRFSAFWAAFGCFGAVILDFLGLGLG